MKHSFAKNHDWLLIITTILLAVFGLLMVYSSSYVFALYDRGDHLYFFKRQSMWLGISLIVFFILMHFPFRAFKKLSPLIILVSIILLILVKTPLGIEDNGAQRWLGIGSFTLQPSEFVKVGMIIYLAQVYSQKQKYINNFLTGVLPPLIIVGLVLGLIMMQPDMGTATSILLVTGLIVFFSGARMIHLGMLGTIGVGLFAYYATSETYRLNRITAFLDPFQDPSDKGHQLIQSYIAIANGGMSGTGLGQSVQKLMYLPERHTDMIMAIISEELGLLGVLFIMACYTLILFKGVLIGVRCKDTFGSLLAFGIVFQLGFQVVFNLGAVTGLLPITGVPLPFISSGGSSLLVSMMSIAILANIAHYNKKQARLNEDNTLSA